MSEPLKEPNRKFVLAVDFDGTITKYNCFPYANEVMPHAAEVIRLLHDLGVVIVLWTCREGIFLLEALDYCRKQDVPIDYANENLPEIDVNGSYAQHKVYGTMYVDDANAGGFIGWIVVLKLVCIQLSSGKYVGDHKHAQQILHDLKNGKLAFLEEGKP
jgi:hydroxymethylpyrimidine pyrophosphatase-like HAD family hydrolase